MVRSLSSLFFVFHLLLVVLFLSHNVEGGVFQRQLLNKLFNSYDTGEVPVSRDDETLNVSISLSLQQIVDLDEKQQMLIFSGWLDIVCNKTTLYRTLFAIRLKLFFPILLELDRL